MRKKSNTIAFLLFLISGLSFSTLLIIDLTSNRSQAPKDFSALVQGEKDTSHPYVGYIISDTNKICAGTLINSNTIISAGHCLGYQSGNKFKFGLGEFQPEASDLANVTLVKFAPGFDPNTNIGLDLAIGTLNKNISLPEYAQLSDTNVDINNCDVTLVAYGSGIPTAAPSNYFMRKNGTGCSKSQGNNFLLEFNSSAGICYGDSGGSVYANKDSNKIIGILSSGLLEANSEKLRCDPGNIGLIANVVNAQNTINALMTTTSGQFQSRTLDSGFSVNTDEIVLPVANNITSGKYQDDQIDSLGNSAMSIVLIILAIFTAVSFVFYFFSRRF